MCGDIRGAMNHRPFGHGTTMLSDAGGPEIAARRDAADLLARRDALAERYRDLATPVWARTAQVSNPSADRGLACDGHRGERPPGTPTPYTPGPGSIASAEGIVDNTKVL